MTHFGGLAQTSVRDVCDMLIPLEAEVKSFHASAAVFLRPQSASLRDHQHPAGRDRARLFSNPLVAQGPQSGPAALPRRGLLPRRGAIVRTGHRRCACLK
jgi:hypothetical protein